MHILALNPLLNSYFTSDVFGKGIFITLFLLSILTWVIFIKKISFQKEAKKRGGQFLEIFQKKRLMPLSLEIPQYSHPFLAIYRSLKQQTIELLNKNRAALQENEKVYLSSADMNLLEAHLMSTISSQTKFFEKNLFVLPTIVSLAPFLGLLGTVWGILLTFAELQSGGSAHANSVVMGGLAMALGTTVIGLLVAIPALIAYNYLKSAIIHFSSDMEDFSHLLLASVEMQYRKVDL